jgi:hypothetical protein
METKESKVTNVQGNGTWETTDGTTFYKFEISMENGDSGEYYAKTQDQTKFKVGEVTTYTYKGGKFPKIKPAWTQNNTGGGSNYSSNREDLIIRQTCIKAGAEISNNPEGAVIAAEVFYRWIIQKEAAEVKERVKQDLPF